MRETSPYEGSVDTLNGKMCLGRVWAVDAVTRTIRVRTLGSKADGTDDLDLQNVKILHAAWHGEGDYMTYIPRVGSYAIIAFFNSEPIVVGYYPISNTFGGGGRDNQDKLDAGDFGIATVAGNRLIVRSGGTVELESTKGCRTYWLPNFDTINTVCQNLEVEPSGGRMHWTVDQGTGNTVMTFVGWDNDTDPTTALKLQIGKTDVDGKTMVLTVGPTDDAMDVSAPNITASIAADGEVLLNVADKAILDIKADGSTNLNVAGKASVDIKPDGTTTIDVGPGQSTVTMTPDGKITSNAKNENVLKAPKTAIGSGPIELLERLFALVEAIGELQIPTNLGPTGPVKTSPLWVKVVKIQQDIKSITGTF